MGFGLSEFLSVKSFFPSHVVFLVLSGWQIQFIFIGKGFVVFHPDFLRQYCSLAKLFFHFIGNLFGECLVGLKSLLVIAKVFIVGKIFQDGFGVRYQSSQSAFRECA